MPTSSERLVEVEAKATQAPHSLHHRSRQRKRLAAKIVLILALIIGGLAVCDFAYNAYKRTDCITEAETNYLGGLQVLAKRSRNHAQLRSLASMNACS